MRLKLKWDALWEQDATLEQVTADEREEYVNEALLEIASKMKRKHKVKTLAKFNILERIDEHVHIAYPDLRSTQDAENTPTDEELKAIALQLLTTGVVNTITVYRDNEQVDVFQTQANEERAYQNWQKQQEARPVDEYELRLKKEREKKQKKMEKEFAQQQEASR